MSDFIFIDLKEVALPVDEILDRMEPDDVVRECFFEYPEAFMDFVVHMASKELDCFSRLDAQKMLSRIDAFRSALEVAAERGDDDLEQDAPVQP